MKTTARFDALPPYPLAEMTALRRTLEAEGVDIIDLGDITDQAGEFSLGHIA